MIRYCEDLTRDAAAVLAAELAASGEYRVIQVRPARAENGRQFATIYVEVAQ